MNIDIFKLAEEEEQEKDKRNLIDDDDLQNQLDKEGKIKKEEE
jgi:hypothetical protein|tara:strand:- start:464 stop:592 length:129 start_codon:yes stop_codon:yes gene_type:complete